MTELSALRNALGGCPKCEWDEAEGGIVNHCNECCRKITAVAWQLVTDTAAGVNPLERHLEAACELIWDRWRIERTFNAKTSQAGYALDGKWAGMGLRDVVAELVRRKTSKRRREG